MSSITIVKKYSIKHLSKGLNITVTNEHVKKGEIEDREQKIISQVDPESRIEVLHEGLKSRHVQLIALGGCIGTGMFVGSGSILANDAKGIRYWNNLRAFVEHLTGGSTGKILGVIVFLIILTLTNGCLLLFQCL